MNGFRWEPAVYLGVLNAIVAAAVAFGLPLSTTQTRAIIVISTAVFAIVTAIMTRPVDISVLIGAGGTIVVAAAAFGLHVSQAQLATGTALVSVVLSLILRQAVSPVPAAAPAEPGAHQAA